MSTDFFEMNTVSTILSWILCIPVIIGILGMCFSVFQKQEGIPILFTIWVGICIMVFSPFRYLILQITVATCYMVQSISAFISTLILAIYVPIIFGLLYLISIGLPIYLSFSFMLKDEYAKKWKLVIASLILPILLVLGNIIFSYTLPYAGWTISWINPKDVIRATNGPSMVVYKYFTQHGTVFQEPFYIEMTHKQDKDYFRCHVACTYLSEKGHAYFVAKQYPHIYEQLKQKGEITND